MSFIDNFLNSITMYRLVLYGLVVLIIISLVFSLVGLIPFTFYQLVITLSIILTVAFIVNEGFKALLHSIANFESALITSLILFFILAPITNITDLWVTVAVSIAAISSKYLLAVEKKHIFNPAAFGIFLLGLFGFGNGIWWVGSTNLLPFVLIIGLLIVRKVRRFHLFWTFIFSAVVTIMLFNLGNGVSVQDSVNQAFLSWPLIFFATVMLTEPLTSPYRKKFAVIYGIIVGVLFGSQFHLGPFFSSPELSLIIGNIFAYIVNPKYKLFLQLKNQMQLAPQIYEFVFAKAPSFSFLPGQYLEWTVPGRIVDSRGNRRYLTIASSPTEENLKIGVKFPEIKPSYFKRTLKDLSDNKITASQLSGDFVIPEDISQKLVFIAGGIGVTPFRSMIKYLLDTKEKRSIVLLYAASTDHEFVYKDIFAQAEKELGLKVVYIITNKNNLPNKWIGETGYLSEEMIRKYVPDFAERKFYLSGPNAMVESYKKLLKSLAIEKSKIVTDYFPGF